MLKLALIVLVVLSLAALIFLILQSKKLLNDTVKQHQPIPKSQDKPQPTKPLVHSKKKR
ncbi:hypothetical protein [Acinetobacter sp. ANC 4641]|uniref:hypothetical protein n=1 Tax=Acinetobacter sp. ANC 4641 TaxID=2529847 RepID=UPI0013F176EA|nr:hypothetical protein [Acinetobacter sp. ANC 4641]